MIPLPGTLTTQIPPEARYLKNLLSDETGMFLPPEPEETLRGAIPIGITDRYLPLIVRPNKFFRKFRQMVGVFYFYLKEEKLAKDAADKVEFPRSSWYDRRQRLRLDLEESPADRWFRFLFYYWEAVRLIGLVPVYGVAPWIFTQIASWQLSKAEQCPKGAEIGAPYRIKGFCVRCLIQDSISIIEGVVWPGVEEEVTRCRNCGTVTRSTGHRLRWGTANPRRELSR